MAKKRVMVANGVHVRGDRGGRPKGPDCAYLFEKSDMGKRNPLLVDGKTGPTMRHARSKKKRLGMFGAQAKARQGFCACVAAQCHASASASDTHPSIRSTPSPHHQPTGRLCSSLGGFERNREKRETKSKEALFIIISINPYRSTRSFIPSSSFMEFPTCYPSRHLPPAPAIVPHIEQRR